MRSKPTDAERTERFVAAFVRRYPRLALPGVSVRDLPASSARNDLHMASQRGDNEIALFPGFWKLTAVQRRMVFAHEIGHVVLGHYGLSRYVALAARHGVDAWNTSALPFGQSNMEEAFADAFMVFWTAPRELKTRYPAWVTIVHEVFEATTSGLRQS